MKHVKDESQSVQQLRHSLGLDLEWKSIVTATPPVRFSHAKQGIRYALDEANHIIYIDVDSIYS